jgi:glycosyltransferase involved in cell wall biosynthesis
VARLQEHKGHRCLIEAVPRVLRSSPDAAFVVVGKASNTRQELYASQLNALCARLGVTESVHFLGYVPDDDLIALYGEASVLVHPALSEGFGLALLQAMAAGVPVVAAASDGPKELIRPGKNGLLAPPGDRIALAELIVQLLKSPELAAKLSVEAKRFAGSFSSTKMTEDTARIYRDVADLGSAR